jgi:hypothetical protein
MISVKNGLTSFEGTIEELISDYATLNIAVRQALRTRGIPETTINKMMTDVLFYSAETKVEGEIIRNETKIIPRTKNEEGETE